MWQISREQEWKQNSDDKTVQSKIHNNCGVKVYLGYSIGLTTFHKFRSKQQYRQSFDLKELNHFVLILLKTIQYKAWNLLVFLASIKMSKNKQ